MQNQQQGTIDDIRAFQEAMNEAAENTDDVKKGESTPEEEKQDPEYILFNAISENTISILELDSVAEIMNNIADKFDDELATNLASLLAILIQQSTFSALVTYDEILKDTINKEFDIYNKAINNISATVNAHNGAMEVFKERIGEIQKKLGLTNAKTD